VSSCRRCQPPPSTQDRCGDKECALADSAFDPVIWRVETKESLKTRKRRTAESSRLPKGGWPPGRAARWPAAGPGVGRGRRRLGAARCSATNCGHSPGLDHVVGGGKHQYDGESDGREMMTAARRAPGRPDRHHQRCGADDAVAGRCHERTSAEEGRRGCEVALDKKPLIRQGLHPSEVVVRVKQTGSHRRR
jgi:hypothetical protein